ncbi:hypothetical protein ABPG72_016275 [Tetrahymena utriculariae]
MNTKNQKKMNMKLDFDDFISRYRGKREILLKLQKSSIPQLSDQLIAIEEKIPLLAQPEVDEIINQMTNQENYDELSITEKKMTYQQMNQSQAEIINTKKRYLLTLKLNFKLTTQLIPQSRITNNHELINLKIRTDDLQSTDDEQDNFEKLNHVFDKRYKVQLNQNNNNHINSKENYLSQLKDPDKMSSNQSIILNKKFKIQSDASEVYLGSSQIFDLAMQNYQILAGKYNEILNNVYLTTTTPSQRESLAKAYKATRLQINQENQASTAYRQRKGEFSETIGEMTKIAIQAIQVLNSEELCKVWQFEKVESGSLTSALQSFIDNYINNNEQKLTENSIQNARIDQDQLEQIVSLSFGLAIFGRQKDFKTDETITDPFFNQIPYVFTNHFQSYQSSLRSQMEQETSKLYQSLRLQTLTIKFTQSYYGKNQEITSFQQGTYSQTQNQQQERNNLLRKQQQQQPKQLTKLSEDQLEGEQRGIKVQKIQSRNNEDQMIQDILNIFPGDKEFQSLVQDCEQQFQITETEKQRRVLYSMFLYYAQQEILSGKASRVEQQNFQRTLNFCVDLSLLWCETLEKIVSEYYISYKNMTKYSYTNVNHEGLTESQVENSINTVLCNILNNTLTITSEKEATMNKKTFSEIIKNMANDSPYAMNYYRRGVSTVEAAFPYWFRYQLPLEYRSSGDNQFIIDAKKEISTRITNAWVKGKYNDTKQLMNENQDMQALIKELVQAGMSSTRYRDFKHTPIAASDQSIQMFNHLMYDIITQFGKLDNPTDDDFKKLDQRLQEKFSIMVENNTGRLILLSENYMSRIKSPDGLKLKAKELAVTYAIRDQDVAFSQEKVPMKELCQNIDGLNRKCAILAYQNFVRDNISNLAVDEGDSLERFQDQLWQKTSTISANIACWMTTIFECCENQDRTQQSPQSIQFYIQRSHFLTDFIDDYPNLDDAITRNATWTKLAQTELYQTTEEQLREALIIISKFILRLQVSSKELEKFKRYIYSTECYRLLNCKNHKFLEIQREITTSEGMEILPRLGETVMGGGGSFWSIFKGIGSGVLSVAGSAIGQYFQQGK